MRSQPVYRLRLCVDAGGSAMIEERFGTVRGLARLALSYAELALGRADIVAPKSEDVRRLVFVCHGNICRSAFADVLAREQGLASASLGLSTSSGKPAHPPLADIAADLGHDMGAHASCRVEDYEPKPGDLLLAMETRHLRKLAATPRLAHLPRTLLGLYARPVIPHLHDPYQLSDAYTLTCLRRIETASPALKCAFPNASAC
jgi:protein-tyrosine phosphatase